jgi:hypothetical protein
MTLWRVLLWAWIGSMVCVVVGVPLAQATGWEDSGVAAILSRIIGHGSLNAVMLLVVHAPLFSILRRLRAINPAIGTLIGALIPLAALLLISNPTATTWSEKLSETIETYIDHPELFASEWLSFFVGGAVFGYLYCRTFIVTRLDRKAA